MLGELDASELDMFKFCAFHEEWCVYGGSELVDVWKHRKKTIDTKRIGKTANFIDAEALKRGYCTDGRVIPFQF